MNTHPKIKALGHLNDVRSYLAIADIFVFPSYREGFPNVVMQAGAMGIPCIVSDINGCNEIIKNNINGIIIPPKNSILLSRTILNLLNNPSIIEDLAKNSRKQITDNYKNTYIWTEIHNQYKEALKQ